jgi:hypothetical protein
VAGEGADFGVAQEVPAGLDQYGVSSSACDRWRNSLDSLRVVPIAEQVVPGSEAVRELASLADRGRVQFSGGCRKVQAWGKD